MEITARELAQKTADAIELFRTKLHEQISSGSDGSVDSTGELLLPLRSVARRSYRCTEYTMQLYEGCGQIPDANVLASWLESEGGEPEDFICMGFSLMAGMDAAFSMLTGAKSSVDQCLDHFLGNGVESRTAASILSRPPRIPQITPSPAPADSSILGAISKASESANVTTKRKRKKKAGVKNTKSSTASRGKKNLRRKTAEIEQVRGSLDPDTPWLDERPMSGYDKYLRENTVF